MTWEENGGVEEGAEPLCPTCYRRKALETPAEWDRVLLQFVCPKCGSYV